MVALLIYGLPALSKESDWFLGVLYIAVAVYIATYSSKDSK